MSQQALPAGQPVARRRAFFGMFDADGWSWAGVKATFWFVVIIFLLGYIPDRAYYFTVERTIDVGLLAWSPINLCPPENEDLPCPAPVGAARPFEPSAAEHALPQPRTDGGAAQVGTKYFYIGGSDASGAPVADVYVADAGPVGNFQPWQAGPSLPEPRTDAAVAFLNGSIYVVGGTGPDGAPTSTVYQLTPGTDGTIPDEWTVVEAEGVTLPEPRTGAAIAAAGDGLILLGGANADGPVSSVWKSRLTKDGELGPWTPQAPLYTPNADGVAAIVGSHVFVMGGRDANGPSSAVHIGTIGAGETAGGDGHGGAAEPSASPGAEEGDPNAVTTFTLATPLPEARTNAAGFTANGVLYLVGGSDGTNPRSELWWSIPGTGGALDGWKHLPQSDLGEGLEGSAALVGGTNAFVIGGETAGGVIAGSARNNLAPQEPFFQLGILGATVPALQIEGEIGQQLGYLNAAGVGTVNFVLLLLIGWAFAHKEQARAFLRRFRR